MPSGPRGRADRGSRRARRGRRDRARGGVVVIAVAEVTPAWYLVLASIIFAIGAVGLLVRRNPLVMFMCVELMLNAVTLTFVTFSRMLDDIDGQTVVVFVLVVAAAEVVVGLGIIVALLRKQPTRHRRRHQRAEGLSRRPMETLDLVWLIPALPLAGFLVLLVLGRRLGEPAAGWVATVACGGAFVATRRDVRRAPRRGRARPRARLQPVRLAPRRRLRGRRRVPGRPAVDHDGPVRHRRRHADPPVLDRRTCTATRTSRSSSCT